jgi:hypothetical protein
MFKKYKFFIICCVVIMGLTTSYHLYAKASFDKNCIILSNKIIETQRKFAFGAALNIDCNGPGESGIFPFWCGEWKTNCYNENNGYFIQDSDFILLIDSTSQSKKTAIGDAIRSKPIDGLIIEMYADYSSKDISDAFSCKGNYKVPRHPRWECTLGLMPIR